MSHGSRASLITQLVKNPPAMQETTVQFLGLEESVSHTQGNNQFKKSYIKAQRSESIIFRGSLLSQSTIDHLLSTFFFCFPPHWKYIEHHSWLPRSNPILVSRSFSTILSFSLGPNVEMAQRVRSLSVMWETQVRSLGWEGPLEKAMATHSSILAWKFPWTEEPDRIQSTGSQRVGNN